MQADKSAAFLRLRKDRLWEHAGEVGVTTERDLALHLKVDRATILRIIRGDIGPGERFIAATLAAFPRNCFEDFFEVASTERTAA